MNIEDILNFLESKPGYKKEGKIRLALLLEKKGYDVSIEDCAEALRLFNNKAETTTNKNKSNFRRMFFDIETSPCIGWFWKPGFKVKLNYDNIIEQASIICVSWKWENEDTVYNITWKELWNDKELLKVFVEELNKADEIIGHNSDKFDIKWLRTRCLFHGIPFNSVIKSLDTLQKARYYFNFPTNRLNDIGRYLNIGEKLPTSPDLWKRVCFNNDKEALKQMVNYCNKDVILLEDIYHKIQSYVDTNTHVGVHNGEGKWTCPSTGSKDVSYIKPIITKSGTIQRHMKSNADGTDYKISNTAYKEFLKCSTLK